jgi:hypothetical protein
MLHEVLAQYLARVEQAILRCSTAYVERYTEEILTPQRANLRIRLRFAQGHVLEVNEAITVVEDNLVPLDYRYHCQDAQNQVIFRYDSTPHFPGLPHFRCSPVSILKKVNPPKRVRLPYHTHRRIDLCEPPKTGANHAPIPSAFIIAE